MRIFAALPGAAGMVAAVHEVLPDPTRLHEQLTAPVPTLQVGKDQQTPFHQRWYARYDVPGPWPFREAYADLLRHIREKLIREPLLAQTRPCLRVHLPGNIATGGFHRDRDYNHDPREVNYVVAVTAMSGTASLWIEDPDHEVLQPVRMAPAEVLEFDGANLIHGSLPNDAGYTRVSLDFRVLRARHYDPVNTRVTVNQGRRFLIGDYWTEIL